MMMEKVVQIPIERITLEGNLSIPKNAKGLVLFAHGSGSGRFSPRNQFVANYLIENQLATLLIDLLTMEEEKIDDLTRELRFDIQLLADRLIGVTDWLLQNPQTQSLSVNYFGSSTGAAAALIAAAAKGKIISSVVSRGGRPDLAMPDLRNVKSPTLLIVGGDDTIVIDLNKQAYAQLTCEKKVEIVPHATHLFEEPGTLDQVAKLACKWFLDHSSLKV